MHIPSDPLDHGLHLHTWFDITHLSLDAFLWICAHLKCEPNITTREKRDVSPKMFACRAELPQSTNVSRDSLLVPTHPRANDKATELRI